MTASYPPTLKVSDDPDTAPNEKAFVPSVAACTTTLTGDIAAVFGGQPLDISGQTVSKTVPGSPANFYAAGASALAVSWSGWRGIGYHVTDFTTAGNSFLGFTLISSDYARSAQVTFDESIPAWVLLVDGVVRLSPISETVTTRAGFRIDGATGDVELYLGATTATKSTITQLGGVFSGKSVIAAPTLGNNASPTLTAGDTYAADVVTGAGLSDFGFPGGTLDWCGSAL